jgi:hypothetical protein
MAFGSAKDLAVLESKFQIYEELSKEMLDKLERAVATISENSNRISLILERHEARLNESDKNDAAIIKLVEKVEEKVKEIDNRVSQLSKFRWITVGIVLAITTIIQYSGIVTRVLTPQTQSSIIEQRNFKV